MKKSAKNNREAKKIWQEKNGTIPIGMELHHIIPRIIGGTNEIFNLEIITRKEHIEKHRMLAEKTQNKYLIYAYKLMSGTKMTDKELHEFRVNCGKIGGRIAVESGQLAKVRNPKLAGEACFKKHKNIMLQRLEKTKTHDTQSRGGKTQGKRNVESGHLQKLWNQSRNTYKIIRDLDGYTIITNNIIQECINNKELYIGNIAPRNRAKYLRYSAIQNNRISFGWRCYKIESEKP